MHLDLYLYREISMENISPHSRGCVIGAGVMVTKAEHFVRRTKIYEYVYNKMQILFCWWCCFCFYIL